MYWVGLLAKKNTGWALWQRKRSKGQRRISEARRTEPAKVGTWVVTL